MIKSTITVAILLLCITSVTAWADTIPQYYIGAQANYGFIIPHSRSIEPVSHTNPFGIELSLNKFHRSPYSRQVFNAYWISGFQAGYFNFQNHAVLGGAYTFSLFAEPVVAYGTRFLFTVRGGAGFSYQSKIFNKTTNPSNKFFSTTISFPLYVSVRLKFQMADHLLLVVSGNYNHISNGGIRQPNYGMNFPTLAVGVEYYQNHYQPPDKVVDLQKKSHTQKMFFTVGVLSALRVIDKTELFPEKKSCALGINVRVSLPLGQIYFLNTGAELILDGYTREVIKREQTEVDYKRFALTMGQDLKFGRVYFSQSMGLYLYSPLVPPEKVYQKYELAFKFKSGLMTGVFLKAHRYNAEMMGVTVNWMFLGSKNQQ